MRVWNSLDNTNTVICCFQKAGFRHHTSLEVEDIEDIPSYEQKILLMEEQVADPPTIQDVDQDINPFNDTVWYSKVGIQLGWIISQF